MSKTRTYENPLVPHKKLRQMFVAMTEMRVLDEHISKLQRRIKDERRLHSTHGQEACRVSTAIELEPGDLISDAHAGVAMELLAGAKAGSLLHQINDLLAKKKTSKHAAKEKDSKQQLPWIEDIEERLLTALGAALSFKTLNRANVVIIYVRQNQASSGVWRKVLGLTEKFTLPVIFVVLPDSETNRKHSENPKKLSAKARAWGVPGIPVDAGDAVALYRVAQESIVRIRSGGGPVLIECIAWHTDGKGKDTTATDPLIQMREFLLGRGVSSAASLDRAGDKLSKRLKSANRKKA